MAVPLRSGRVDDARSPIERQDLEAAAGIVLVGPDQDLAGAAIFHDIGREFRRHDRGPSRRGFVETEPRSHADDATARFGDLTDLRDGNRDHELFPARDRDAGSDTDGRFDGELIGQAFGSPEPEAETAARGEVIRQGTGDVGDARSRVFET